MGVNHYFYNVIKNETKTTKEQSYEKDDFILGWRICNEYYVFYYGGNNFCYYICNLIITELINLS